MPIQLLLKQISFSRLHAFFMMSVAITHGLLIGERLVIFTSA